MYVVYVLPQALQEIGLMSGSNESRTRLTQRLIIVRRKHVLDGFIFNRGLRKSYRIKETRHAKSCHPR
jgi:hypothetical protein